LRSSTAIENRLGAYLEKEDSISKVWMTLGCSKLEKLALVSQLRYVLFSLNYAGSPMLVASQAKVCVYVVQTKEELMLSLLQSWDKTIHHPFHLIIRSRIFELVSILPRCCTDTPGEMFHVILNLTLQ
jgi:hypothetical protein